MQQEKYWQINILNAGSLCWILWAPHLVTGFLEYMADLKCHAFPLDELYKMGAKHRLHMHHWFFSSDLTSYWRGGRISRAKVHFSKCFVSARL